MILPELKRRMDISIGKVNSTTIYDWKNVLKVLSIISALVRDFANIRFYKPCIHEFIFRNLYAVFDGE